MVSILLLEVAQNAHLIVLLVLVLLCAPSALPNTLSLLQPASGALLTALTAAQPLNAQAAKKAST